jgi:hypothetical protein
LMASSFSSEKLPSDAIEPLPSIADPSGQLITARRCRCDAFRSGSGKRHRNPNQEPKPASVPSMPRDRVIKRVRKLIEQTYLESVGDQSKHEYARLSEIEKRVVPGPLLQKRIAGSNTSESCVSGHEISLSEIFPNVYGFLRAIRRIDRSIGEPR